MPSPGEDVQSWSKTAADNAGADPLINWAEGMPRADVNNSARSVLAAVAKWRDLQNGSIVTGGTANAQTFLSGIGYTTPVPTGLLVRLKIGPGLTNTATTTLGMDGITAAVIKDQLGADLGGGRLREGAYASFVFNGTNWILLGDLLRKWTVTVLTATNAAWPVPAGTSEMQVELWGGGGAGGGAFAGFPNNSRGGGGGGGGYVFKYFAGTMDATLNVTIGAGGGAVGDGSTGTAGGNTGVVGANLGTFSALGGAGGGSTALSGVGGAGGGASGGDLNITGGDGCVTPGGFGYGIGWGGSSPRGGAGGATNVASPGIIPGGGGAGANHPGGTASGAGAAGRAIIWTR